MSDQPIVRRQWERVRVSRDNRSPEVGAKQSFADEADINKQMALWRRPGVGVPPRVVPPSYGDFTNASDYLEACQRVVDAQEAFNSLPAKVRRRFENSPAQLLDFVADPANTEEAIELGLVEAPAEEPPMEPEAVADETPTE